jgi:hypothetical protein
MSFASYINYNQPCLPFLMRLGRYWSLIPKDDQFIWLWPATGPRIAPETVERFFSQPATACLAQYNVGRALAEGPKVFSFDALTCEALENLELNLSTTEYHQPFSSVVIELPADYSRKRVVPFPAGESGPDFVIVRHEKDLGYVLITMHTSSRMETARILRLDPELTLEKVCLREDSDAVIAIRSSDEFRQRAALRDTLTRLALNVCLMATAYGTKCSGAANPSHLARLKRHAEKARKRGPEQYEKAQMQVQAMPYRYSFAQQVTLFHEEQAARHHEGDGSSGCTHAPHWRRGHWRNAPCGPGRQARRRVMIPSVLVNDHLFLGPLSDTLATFRVRPSNGEAAASATPQAALSCGTKC